jgi:putative nucleotidyltransferase with HDIG domain
MQVGQGQGAWGVSVRIDRKPQEARESAQPEPAKAADVQARTASARSALYVAGVILAGAVVGVHSVRSLAREPVGIEWAFFIGLTIASGWATLRIPGMPISFSISDIFSIASALVFGPAAGALTAALDGLVLSFRMATSQRSFSRIAFNASAPAIAIWVASQAYVALAGPRPRIEGPLAALWLLASLMIFGLLGYGLNTGIVAVAVGLERRLKVRDVWRQHFAGLWLNYFGGAFGGMLLMLLSRLHTLDVVILLIPLPVIIYTAFRHAVGRSQDQISHLGKVNRVYVAAIEALAQAVDAKDDVTHEHVRRVQDRSVELARSLGVEDEAEVQAIKAASLLHDVGKLAIPEHILNKPGRLTPAEYEIMKRHAAIGADILSVIDFPYPVAPIVRHHHENWDGTGYPDGIVGDRIPIGSRIVSVVDCFDALTSDRPYRPRMSDADALKILAERSGTMYDPRVVRAFFALHDVESPPAPLALPASHHAQPLAPPGDQPAACGVPELRACFALGHALTAGRPATDLARFLHAGLQPLLPAVAVVVYAYDATDDTIAALCQAGTLPSGVRPGAPIPLGERLSGWVAATGRSVINSDARLDLDEAVRETSALRSALAVQVAAGQRLLGVLTFYAAEADAFRERHRDLLQAVADALGASCSSLRDLAQADCAGTEQPPARMKHAS